MRTSATFGAAGLTHDVDVAASVEQVLEPSLHHFVVIEQEDPYRSLVFRVNGSRSGLCEEH